MATTKELLERMVLKVGADASAPSPDSGAITILSSTDTTLEDTAYTPSYDGYVYVRGNTNSDNVAFVGIYLKDYNGVNAQQGRSGYPIQFMTRVRRGVVCYLYHSNMSTVVYKFIKSVGGGLKALAETLERGGAIWLRLRVYLTRQFATALSKRTSSTQTRQFVSQTSRTTRSSHTLALQTEWCESSAIKSRLSALCPTNCVACTDGLATTVLNLSLLHIQFGKVRKLLSCIRQQTTRAEISSFSSFLRLNSFAMGGI